MDAIPSIDTSILPQARDRAAHLLSTLRASVADLDRTADRKSTAVPGPVLLEGRSLLTGVADAVEALLIDLAAADTFASPVSEVTPAPSESNP